MKTDIFGQQILDHNDLCSAYLANPELAIKQALVAQSISFNEILNLQNIPNLVSYTEPIGTVESFDSQAQSNWYMPQEYQNIDIAQLVLDRCKNDSELQRAGEELIMFQERKLFPLLCYLKYLVDTMRKHNIVWGVGRGSSVASFVLYLLEVHRINSLHYDLPISEFLK